MLIELDGTLYEYLSNKIDHLNEESEEIIALNNIGTAYRNGWHIIIGSLKVLKYIRNMDLIENSTKRVFEKLINEYTFQKSYKDNIGEFILIKGVEQIFNKDVRRNFFEVSLNYFSDMTSCFRTMLLCEDESDYDFYIKLAKKFIKENKSISNLGLSFSFANGGGANAYKVLERLLNENGNPILSIADSDKKYPSAAEGQTLLKQRRIENKYSSSRILEVYSIQVRAKENLIPPTLYLMGANSSLSQQLKILKLIEEQAILCEKLMYFNIKDGYKVKHFYDEAFLEYFNFFEMYNFLSSTIEEIKKIDNKEDTVIPGFSGITSQFVYNILDDGLEKQLEKKKTIPNITPEISASIELIEKNIEDKRDLFNKFPDYLKVIVIPLCKKIIDWGCNKGEMFST